MLNGEATNTIFIVFGLNLLGVEPKIYRTRGEHANQYTTDGVCFKQDVALSTITQNHNPIPTLILSNNLTT
jgi:hypothetical protein